MSSTVNSLEGRWVAVTGSTGGVGARLVEHFLGRGARVVGIDRANGDRQGHDRLVQLRADLAKVEDVERTVTEIALRTEALEIVVLCAGVFSADPEPGDARRYDRTLEELWRNNVASAVLPLPGLRPLLARGQRPLVAIVSSADGVVASAGCNSEVGATHDVLYAITKGSLVTLARSLAMKWAEDGIRVNAICPTLIRTGMTAELLADARKEAELRESIPLGDLCEVEDLAVAVDCLYELRMTTAHLLTLDGGYLCL